MTTLGKCLVLFTVAASFAFLGFAWVSLRGGPNWDAEAAALPEYSFARSEDGRWTVTDRQTLKTVSVQSPNVAAAAIVAARNDLAAQQTAEIKQLDEQTKQYNKLATEANEFNAKDKAALDARIAELKNQLEELNRQILKLSNDVVEQSQIAQAIRSAAAKRREDVYRLSRELEELRADRFHSDQLQARLKDQLERLNGVVVSLEARNQQLRAAGSASPAPPISKLSN